MDITKLVGMNDKNAKLLKKEGYSTAEDLLELTDYALKKLAKTTGVPNEELDAWQEHADLMRIDGVTPQSAYGLNEAGVDSVKELAQRNPKNTVDRMNKLGKAKKDLIGKIPTQTDVKKWVDQAKKMGGKETVPKKKPPKKTPKKVPKKAPKKTPKKKPTPKEGDYGEDYWNDKWDKAPIIYTGRALRGKSYNQQIDVDVKNFIKDNDEILKHVINQAKLIKSTNNETAHACQKFVNEFLTYKYDEESADCVEFWQFPFETIQSSIGDCELVITNANHHTKMAPYSL